MDNFDWSSFGLGTLVGAFFGAIIAFVVLFSMNMQLSRDRTVIGDPNEGEINVGGLKLRVIENNLPNCMEKTGNRPTNLLIRLCKL